MLQTDWYHNQAMKISFLSIRILLQAMKISLLAMKTSLLAMRIMLQIGVQANHTAF